MKRKIIILAALILCLTMLTGCFCQHEWAEASCTSPSKCSICEKTEGEPLGHRWEEATCAVPKTCAACGETEGETLPHTWVEATCSMPKNCTVCGITEGNTLDHIWDGNANFQDPDVCTVCGAEGECLLPYFEEVGLAVNVQEGITYDYITCPPYHEDKEAIAQFTASNYRIFESDDKHPAKDGYEWRAVDIHIVFDDEPFKYGTGVFCVRSDYYVVSGLGFSDTFTVDYHGVDYTDCYGTIENDDFVHTKGEPTSFMAECYFQVPIGYDGVVLAFYNMKTDMKDVYMLHEMDDPNMLIFRFA